MLGEVLRSQYLCSHCVCVEADSECMGGGDLHERPGNLMTVWIIVEFDFTVPPSRTQTLPTSSVTAQKLYHAVFCTQNQL